MPDHKGPNIISRLLFHWVTPVVRRNLATPLDVEGLLDLPSDASSEELGDKVHARMTSLSNRTENSKNPVHLAYALLSTFRTSLARCILLSLTALTATLALPLLLREVIRTVEHREVNTASAVGFALLLFGASVTALLANHHLFYQLPLLAMRCRASLNTLIYRKALRLKRSAFADTSSGFIVNLVGTDSQKVFTFLTFLSSIWAHPLQLVVGISLIYYLIGIPALYGSTVLVALLTSSILISRKQLRLRAELSRIADARITLTHESLAHIKAAKFQGWEGKLRDKIDSYRATEVSLSRSLIRLSALVSFTSGSAPALAMAITCLCALQAGVSLTPSTVFPLLSLFMFLRFALNHLPSSLFALLEAWVGLRRIYSFLTLPDFTPPETLNHNRGALDLKNFSCEWRPGVPAINVPALSILPGELVVVVGSVGSGKSALLLSILGELDRTGGSCETSGDVLYIPQTPWITSSTIRSNILCDEPFEEARYRKALEASCLEHDLANFPMNDLTEIGERGINLSGGQKHRVALARALYKSADILLLDDPLSALDPKVARSVFTALRSKEYDSVTRIVVTHRVEFAYEADKIIVIEDGHVIEEGKPPTLLTQKGSRFSQLLAFHDQVNGSHQSTPPTPHSSLDAEPAQQSEEIVAGGKTVEDEDREIGSVRSGIVHQYFRLLAPGAIGIALVALFIARQGAALGADLWLSDSARFTEKDGMYFLSGYLSCILLLCSLAYIRSRFLLGRGLFAGRTAHSLLLQNVLSAPLRFFEANPVGRILNRFSKDLETIELSLPQSLLDAGHCLCETITVCLVIACIAPGTLFVIAPVMILYFVLQRMYRPLSRDAQRMVSTSLSPIFTTLSESLAGIETLRASGLVPSSCRRFARFIDLNMKVWHTHTAGNRWVGVRLELLGSLVVLCTGLSIVLSPESILMVGLSGLMLSYASNMTSAMNWAIRSISIAESNLTSFERIEHYTRTTSEAKGGLAPPPEWPHAGQIILSKLTVRYRPELLPALLDISVEIPSGCRVGIVGRTGSGKSTLILSFMRLLEAESGAITIDGINISQLDLSDLRSRISVVSQEPVLFSGPLRESVDPFGEFSDTEVLDSLTRVGLGPKVSQLASGLRSEVYEGGSNFSAGERQLICLARALLRKSKVIILDEATASVDAETDYLVQQTIRNECKGATLLVIAHRLGTIGDSDLIMVIENGRLVEVGKPQQLLKRDGSHLSAVAGEISRVSTEYQEKV